MTLPPGLAGITGVIPIFTSGWLTTFMLVGLRPTALAPFITFTKLVSTGKSKSNLLLLMKSSPAIIVVPFTKSLSILKSNTVEAAELAAFFISSEIMLA